jgi:hypothetical protein
MIQLRLRSQNSVPAGTCALCGELLSKAHDNQLVREDTGEPVCPDCGHNHAPALAALVHLANAAQRVTRIGRHSVFPPLAALLDLASAAEKYTCASTSSSCSSS